MILRAIHLSHSSGVELSGRNGKACGDGMTVMISVAVDGSVHILSH